MSKKVLMVTAGVAGVVGVVLLVRSMNKNSGNPGATDNRTGLLDFLNSGFGYPYRPAAQPRVDNKNQPDSNASRVTFGPRDSSDMQKVAQDIGAAGSIVQSLSDIWDTFDVGSLFGNDSTDLESGDSMSDFNWDTYFADTEDDVSWSDTDTYSEDFDMPDYESEIYDEEYVA